MVSYDFCDTHSEHSQMVFTDDVEEERTTISLNESGIKKIQEFESRGDSPYTF